MAKKLFKTNGTGDKVASVGDLERDQMMAMLKTLAEDEFVIIHKLEIRKKAGENNYRVIVRASREKSAQGE